MRKAATTLASTLVIAGLITAAPASYADSNSNGKDVSVTSTDNVDWWGTVETQIDWCDTSAHAGATLNVTLPAQLSGFKPDFSAQDAGRKLATATVSGHAMTLRLNQELPSGTCATAQLQSTLINGESLRGTDLKLRFNANGAPLENRLHVRDWHADERQQANAWGEFADNMDQCRTNGTACLVWHWDSMGGPFKGGVISGRPAEGQAFVCDQVTVDLAELGTHEEVTSTVAWTGRVRCTPQQLRVGLDAVPAGSIARVNAPVTVTPQPDGGITYQTEFVASNDSSTSIAKDTETSTTASLVAKSAGAGDDGPMFRPDQLQGAWPFLAIGGLLVAAIGAVVVRRKRAAR